MARLQAAVGGVSGVGGTVALRELYDQDGGVVGDRGSILDRLSRPSVLYGLGTGLTASALWYLDETRVMDTTPMGIDNIVWATHGMTATTSGAASALFPADRTSSGSSGSSQGASATLERVTSNSMSREEMRDAGASEGGSDEEYAPAE